MNKTRAERIREMFTQKGADFRALVCRLPQNVLMLTGYQPILGNSFCIVTLNPAKEVEIRLAVPKDEEELVPPGVAVEIKTFSEETMDYIGNTIQAVREPLAELLRSASINENAVVGIEGVYSPIATSYTQVGAPGPATLELLHRLFLGGELHDATSMFDELAAIKTDEEIEAIKRSEEVALQGFEAAREAIYVGGTEAEVAAETYAALLRTGYAAQGAKHVLPRVHVMAGKRAALAYR
ncbi:MAG TPA: poly-gamma-glutamate hydrolase family protein, partial [Ktedonobacteraceae bacterium]|nr:poly-gamma-glutamate hydrolase family protein [Ktedonobacteraceae bacterium]